MIREEKKRNEMEQQPSVDTPSTQTENTGAQEPVRNLADTDLSDLDRNLNEQIGGTGTTVRIEPNRF